jgi:hypothetical protein
MELVSGKQDLNRYKIFTASVPPGVPMVCFPLLCLVDDSGLIPVPFPRTPNLLLLSLFLVKMAIHVPLPDVTGPRDTLSARHVDSRYLPFSWSNGLRSIMVYITPTFQSE